VREEDGPAVSDQSEPEREIIDSRRARMFRRADAQHVPLRTIFITVAIVVAVYLTGKILVRLRDILMLFVVGGFIALILNPQVVALQRWKIRRRGGAVALVILWSTLIFIAIAITFGYPLVHGMTHLAHTLPSYVKRVQNGRGWIGHLLRRYHADQWIKRTSSKLVSLAKGLSKPALALGKGAVTVILALTTLFAYVVLLLLQAPKIRTTLLSMMQPERAAKVSRVSAMVSRAAMGYVVGNALTSLCAGMVVFVTLLVLSVPFALLWALWVALVDFLPVIGAALAGIPTVLFAFGHSFVAGIVTLVVFLIYTQFENHVLNPVVMSHTVKISPLTVLISVLVGAELGAWVGGLFGGFIGVLLAVPLAATIHVLVREIWTSTAPATIQLD
jgi:predicted PurR-regulated permease PerM